MQLRIQQNPPGMLGSIKHATIAAGIRRLTWNLLQENGWVKTSGSDFMKTEHRFYVSPAARENKGPKW